MDFLNRYHKHNTVESNKLAYLAGLIDGEGYLKIEKQGTARLIIGMTCKKTIMWCFTEFGGTFGNQRTLQSGKTFYVWRINKILDVLKILILCYPYLITKKEKTLLIIDLLKNRLMKHKDFNALKGLTIGE